MNSLPKRVLASLLMAERVYACLTNPVLQTPYPVYPFTGMSFTIPFPVFDPDPLCWTVKTLTFEVVRPPQPNLDVTSSMYYVNYSQKTIRNEPALGCEPEVIMIY